MRWFSLDHKVIGLQYAVTSMIFLLVGFSLMMLLRWQLAYPMQPIPLIGGLLGSHQAVSGIMLPLEDFTYTSRRSSGCERNFPSD